MQVTIDHLILSDQCLFFEKKIQVFKQEIGLRETFVLSERRIKPWFYDTAVESSQSRISNTAVRRSLFWGDTWKSVFVVLRNLWLLWLRFGCAGRETLRDVRSGPEVDHSTCRLSNVRMMRHIHGNTQGSRCSKSRWLWGSLGTTKYNWRVTSDTCRCEAMW